MICVDESGLESGGEVLKCECRLASAGGAMVVRPGVVAWSFVVPREDPCCA